MIPSQAHKLFGELRAATASRYPVVRGVKLVICRKHFLSRPKERDLAWYDIDTRTVHLVAKALEGPDGRVAGLLAHELGHAADPVPDAPYAELRADAMAKKALGTPVRYDADDVQNLKHGVTPRPPRLPENRPKGAAMKRNPTSPKPTGDIAADMRKMRLMLGTANVAGTIEGIKFWRKTSQRFARDLMDTYDPESLNYRDRAEIERVAALDVNDFLPPVPRRDMHPKHPPKRNPSPMKQVVTDRGTEVRYLPNGGVVVWFKNGTLYEAHPRGDSYAVTELYDLRDGRQSWTDEFTESQAAFWKRVQRLDPEIDSPKRNPASTKSNWDGFMHAADIGTLDLDAIAYETGYKNWRNLDLSISPRTIAREREMPSGSARFRKFVKAIRDNSVKLAKASDQVIAAAMLSARNPAKGYKMPEAQARHTAEGLLARMKADGADTFAKKVKWVKKHIPSVDQPRTFVGWVTKGERGRVVRNPTSGYEAKLKEAGDNRAKLYRSLAGKTKQQLLAMLGNYYRFHSMSTKSSKTDLKYAITSAAYPDPRQPRSR